jgi:hypothetical protein
LNGEVIGDIEDPIVTRPIGEVTDREILRSDCRYRLDRNLFIQGRLEEADAAKLALEGMQRKEEGLRGGQTGEQAGAEAPPPPPQDEPAQKESATAAAGKSIKSGFSAFKKFAGKQLSKLGKGD